MINDTIIQNNYSAQYYLNLKSTNYKKWKEKWECMLFEPKENYTDLLFEELPLSDVNDQGQFFKLNEIDLHNPFIASEEEINDASIWVIPGALSTSKFGMSSTLLDIKALSNGTNYYLLKDKQIVFCPYSIGEERYREAMRYDDNQQEYYSEKIKKFVRKYFIQRLVKERKLAFITHDIGGKELAMIENAARDILLNEYHYPVTMIKKLFQSVSAVCIGYATDIENLPDLRFQKISILSASDQGIFIPQSLYYKIYKPNICNRPFTAFRIDQYETLIFLGHQTSVEIFDGKLNYDGHQLPHYLNATIKSLPSTLLKYLHSLIFENNALDKSLERELDQLLET